MFLANEEKISRVKRVSGARRRRFAHLAYHRHTAARPGLRSSPARDPRRGELPDRRSAETRVKRRVRSGPGRASPAAGEIAAHRGACGGRRGSPSRGSDRPGARRAPGRHRCRCGPVAIRCGPRRRPRGSRRARCPGPSQGGSRVSSIGSPCGVARAASSHACLRAARSSRLTSPLAATRCSSAASQCT